VKNDLTSNGLIRCLYFFCRHNLVVTWTEADVVLRDPYHELCGSTVSHTVLPGPDLDGQWRGSSSAAYYSTDAVSGN
jgi:hypothetical protein